MEIYVIGIIGKTPLLVFTALLLREMSSSVFNTEDLWCQMEVNEITSNIPWLQIPGKILNLIIKLNDLIQLNDEFLTYRIYPQPSQFIAI